MTSIAVLAHSAKTFDGGLPQLRRTLAGYGFADPPWVEVMKAKKIPKQARRLRDEGADLIFVWGGDGTVQRSLDALAGSGVHVAILPAGTANLFASNLGIPKDLEEAVRVGLHGARRTIDVGKINGEHFGVMAGAGLDALMIRDADGGLKDRIGRARLCLHRREEPRARPGADADRGRRRQVVQRQGELRAGRQRRQRGRRHLRVPRCDTRRRHARHRRDHCGSGLEWLANVGAIGGERAREVAVRPDDHGVARSTSG